MGDPLSIAASVAGLITIAAQIVRMAKELFDRVKDAPETVMRVREEVESMQPIFYQVHLLLNGAGSRPNHGNLTMISIHNLMATLTGCVIVYTRLEKKVNEVCGFNDPTTASATWKRVGVMADQVKWGLWRNEEILVIIEDLQRQKRSLNLMLTIITCTTTTEASEVQARLLELCIENLQSNHAHSVLLRDLIGRQDAVLNRQDEQARILEEIRDRPYPSTVGDTGSSSVSTRPLSAGGSPSSVRNPPSVSNLSSAGSNPSSTGSNPSGHRGNSDNASIMSKQSTLSLRLGPSTYIEDLKASRAYKRLRHFGREIDSSSDSLFSVGSGCSTGNWSMLSDITLGDLSVSQIAVLNLPIDMSDVSNPEPFQDQLSIDKKPRSHPHRWSARGRIRSAIENGNEFVVRTMLAMGMDIEELDSSGRTPLIHATMKYQEAICKLLLEKGASVEALKVFTSGMTPTEKFELLSCRIHVAASGGHKTALQLLLDMGADINEKRSDVFDRTPLIGAVFNNHLPCVKLLIERGADATISNQNRRTVLHYAAEAGYEQIMKFLLDVVETRKIVDMKNSSGNTALHNCSLRSKRPVAAVEIAKLLLQAGATLTIENSRGQTSYETARIDGRNELAKYLWSQLSPEQQAQEKPPLSCW